MKLLTLATQTILLLSFSFTSVWADTPISSLPFTINTSGSYYLTNDLTSTETGIFIGADHVTIDLRGHSLIGSGSTSYSGVYTQLNSNIVVKNGTIRNFANGISSLWETSSSFHVINVRLTGNLGSGISLGGPNHLIEACITSNNGTYGIYVGPGSSVLKSTAYNNVNQGIVAGDGSTLIGNTAYSNGIHGISGGTGSTMSQNTAHSNGNSGLFCTAGCTIVENTAYGNQNHGIVAYTSSNIKNNTAHSNKNTGILLYANSNCLVDGNTAYDNGTNISLCDTCTFGLNHAP